MWHRNAKLTYLSRLDLVHQVEEGWSQSEVARQFRVSRPTVSKYVRRYAEDGTSGLLDRSSRPFTSNRERLAELSRYLDYYNYRRAHGGINGAVPASRL